MTAVSEAVTSSAMRTREATVRRFALTDMVFRAATRASAILVLVLLGGVAISLFAGSWEALSKFGISFLTTESWNPVTENFGALAPIYGTVVTSATARTVSSTPIARMQSKCAQVGCRRQGEQGSALRSIRKPS